MKNKIYNLYIKVKQCMRFIKAYHNSEELIPL